MRSGTSSTALRAGLRMAAVVALLVVSHLPVNADDPETLHASTRAFLARVSAKDVVAAIDQLDADGNDPWIVVDELLGAGRPKLALAIAAAELTSDTVALQSYAAHPPKPLEAERARFARARARAGDGDPDPALAEASAPFAGATVSGVRLLQLAAALHVEAGHQRAAMDALERAARIAKTIGWQRAEIDAGAALLERVGDIVDRTGRRKTELRLLRDLVGLDRGAVDVARSAVWCCRLGALEEAAGNPRQARTWLLEGLSLIDAIARNRGLPLDLQLTRTRAMIDLCNVNHSLNETRAALVAADRAYEMAFNIPIPRDAREARVVQVLRFGAVGARARGSHLVARRRHELELRKQALLIAEDIGPRARVIAFGEIGRLHVVAGRFEEAASAYARATELVDGGRPWYVLQLHIANAWLDEADSEGGPGDRERHARRALGLLHEMEAALGKDDITAAARHMAEANAAALCAHALNALGRYDKAEQRLRVALASPYLRDEPGFEVYLNRELAYALRMQGQTKEALILVKRAFSDFRHELDGLPASLALSQLADSSTARLCDELVACAFAHDREAFRAALEETRGMVSIAEAGRRRMGGGAGAGRRDASALASMGEDVVASLLAYWNARSEDKGRRTLRELRRAVWSQRARLRRAEEARALKAEVPTAPATPEGIRFPKTPALRANEALLYVVAVDGRYRAVLDWKKRVHVFDLDPVAKIDAVALAARKSWIDPRGEGAHKATRKLVAALFPPALATRLGVDVDRFDEPGPVHVYVTADGATARLPWPVLLEELFAASGKPRTDAPGVSLVASRRLLGHIRLRNRWSPALPGGRMTALGDPEYTDQEGRPMHFLGERALARLESSASEVTAITDETRDVVLLGRDANERNLRACLSNEDFVFDILHFACHGRLYPDKPWLSALALHQTRGDDGFVTAEEIGQWDFRDGPRLVVLAACDSGLGAPIKGEGEDGLVRAFFQAGARNVVASLWRVPDSSTSKLMQAFYTALREDGLSPVAALRRAQQEMRGADEKMARARHWAGWAVWGPRD